MLYDKQTLSLWMHLTGECIDGPLEGTSLPLYSGRHLPWHQWKLEHPETTVMAEQTRFLRRYAPEKAVGRGRDYFPRGFLTTLEDRDDRLAPSSLCYGIRSGDATKAYPFAELEKLPGGIVNDRVGPTPVVVAFLPESRTVAGHSRRLQGQTLEFERQGRFIIDRKSAAKFNLDGVCIEGPWVGRRLEPIVGIQAEWYGWYATYPGTELFVAP